VKLEKIKELDMTNCSKQACSLLYLLSNELRVLPRAGHRSWIASISSSSIHAGMITTSVARIIKNTVGNGTVTTFHHQMGDDALLLPFLSRYLMKLHYSVLRVCRSPTTCSVEEAFQQVRCLFSREG